MKSCKGCGIEFVGHKLQEYCTVKCQRTTYNQKSGLGGGASDRNVTGAASELIVCADLLRRGFEVFRNVAPSGPSDMIIKKGDWIRTVDVKTGRINKLTGNLLVCKGKFRSQILAVVVNNQIIYDPELPL